MVIHLFGDRLKELRKNNNLTQDDIAKMFNVTKNAVYSWEVNKTQPSMEIIVALAKYFNVTTDYLLGLNKNDIDEIDKLNIALREAGMVNSNETLKKEEIELAIDQVRQYKQLWKRVNDLPNKYPDTVIKQEKVDNSKDTID